MYNMDISLFGYKISVEVLILIAILYLIIVGHSVCSCCNFYSLIEGMETVDASNVPQEVKDKVNAKVQQMQANAQLPAQTTSDGTSTTTTEGFTGANINYGESSLYDLDNNPIDTSSWSAQDMTIRPGQPVSAAVKAFMARPQQQLPLPEGEMLLFANTKFAPEFCPNTYSTSSGCAEMTMGQFSYLQSRGGNNVPYSEY